MRNWLLGLTIIIIGQAFAQAPAFPFPQHTTYTAGSIKPTVTTQAGLDKTVKQFYSKWKSRYLVPGCDAGQYYVFYNYEGFADPANAICVSEGQGYGMLITAMMAGYDPNAKTYFDGLYLYYKAHPSIINPTLMAWQQVEGCEDVPGADAATDGDLDIAYALLLAHAQWGSAGAINYLSEAINLIDAIYDSEINHNNQTIKLGDWVSGSVSPMSYSTRSSDFMPDHFRSFFDATGDVVWNQTIDRCYTIADAIQTNYSSATGLMPDFIRHTNTAPDPAAPNFLESNFDGDYYYNACRFPWRIATDYLIYGDMRALETLTPLNAWIKTKTSSTPANIKSGYDLDLGTVLAGSNYNDLAFQAPFAVSAMVASTNQTWLNNLWNYMKTVNINRDGYYGNSIKLLSLIVISGNWWAPDPDLFKNGTTQLTSENTITIYPNPVSDAGITVGLNLMKAETVKYKIYSLTGVEMPIGGSFEGNNGINNFELPTAALPAGNYLIVMNTISKHLVQQFSKI